MECRESFAERRALPSLCGRSTFRHIFGGSGGDKVWTVEGVSFGYFWLNIHLTGGLVLDAVGSSCRHLLKYLGLLYIVHRVALYAKISHIDLYRIMFLFESSK